MINIEQIKQKILEFVKEKGPALPVPLSRHIELSPTFTSAILAELSNEKRIKMSNLKVGSSPLYLLQGQEPQLENFLDNIEGAKKTALLKLKQNKILEDEKQDPAIRVALRSIRDFAIPLRFQGRVIWKYFTTPNEEAQALMNKTPLLPPQKVIIQKNQLGTAITTPQKLPETSEKTPIQLKTKKKKEKRKKPEKFLEDLKQFLFKKDIELLKEISEDKKEIIAITRINSDLGKISFLTVAKDKKRVSEADLTVAYQKAQHEKMPCLFLSYGEPGKKTQEWLEDYKNIIKTMTIK